MKFETRAIHVGQEPDAETGAVMPPIYATSTFAQIRPGETLLVHAAAGGTGSGALQIGKALGVSTRTVDRHWRYARAWLYRALRDGGPEDASVD